MRLRLGLILLITLFKSYGSVRSLVNTESKLEKPTPKRSIVIIIFGDTITLKLKVFFVNTLFQRGFVWKGRPYE